jgi:hypothetical protein
MSTTTDSKKAATDLYQSHDHYLVDELLTEEHKLIRDTARKHVSKHLKPIIEERFEKATFSRTSSRSGRDRCLRSDGARGIRRHGPGPDQLWLIMQEIERCDSGLRSLCSVQGFGDVPHLEVRQRRAEDEVAARYGGRQEDRLLRPYRTRPR